MPKVQNLSLGNLVSYTTGPTGFSGTTTCGHFRVTIYNEGIVRVSATLDAFESASYAVVATPDEKPWFKLTESDSHLLITLPQFKVRISKHPVRFAFVTTDDRTINEDDDFGIAWNGEQVAAYKKLQDGERFVGLGEKTGGLDRRGSGYQNWNTDSYHFGPITDPLYCSTPFYIGIHNQLAYGIFFDNPYKSFFNFGASNNRFSSFYADAGDMDYYFLYDGTVAGIVAHYTFLTGRIELPPLWSLGYQQCRYSYYPDKEVLTVAKTFREKKIPADVIVLDIHYMDDYKIFSWSRKHFEDPKQLIANLKSLGFHVVVICDPGIKIEQGYAAYEDGMREDVFLKYPDGSIYSGQVWPGWCHFPDFSSPKARDWWMRQFRLYTDMGIEGFWNDMNEIATWGNMVPENIEFDFDGEKGTMRKGRNLYGLQMARSTFEGARKLLNGKRPFNLTRSGFSGVQRYGAVWTGDNTSSDEHMLLGARMVSNMGLAGIAFAGYDVGGFVGEASARLFARWIALGAFAPFYRGHTMINTRDSEPWSFGEEVEQIARNYIAFRYQLMPYIYSLFYEASKTGMPVQRSLVLDYPFDPRIYDGRFYSEYLFGPWLLVCPVASHQDMIRAYLPAGDWYYLHDGSFFQGDSVHVVDTPLHLLPIFVKGGAIIPMQEAIQHTHQKPAVLLLHIYFGKHNTSFEFYTDDGETYAYQDGVNHRRMIHFRPVEQRILLEEASGTHDPVLRVLKVILHGFDQVPQTFAINGNAIPIEREVMTLFSPLERYDPFYSPAPAQEEKVHFLQTDYISGEISITW